MYILTMFPGCYSLVSVLLHNPKTLYLYPKLLRVSVGFLSAIRIRAVNFIAFGLHICCLSIPAPVGEKKKQNKKTDREPIVFCFNSTNILNTFNVCCRGLVSWLIQQELEGYTCGQFLWTLAATLTSLVSLFFSSKHIQRMSFTKKNG